MALGSSRLGSDFMLDIPEPEAPGAAPEGELAAPLFGAGDALLSLEFEAVESAGLLLQPSTTKDK
jgi:hypothetical protein